MPLAGKAEQELNRKRKHQASVVDSSTTVTVTRVLDIFTDDFTVTFTFQPLG